MSIDEFLLLLDNKTKTKVLTTSFNQLSVTDRKSVLSLLSAEESAGLIKKLRNQAVADFWTHEQELIKNGQSTRNWTPEQIEDILHISEKTGKMSINGDVAYDIDGKSYYGHHMLNVAEHPEYAGDWRNIQALNHDEHYKGAHDGNTSNPTNGFYDVSDGKTKTFDVEKLMEEAANSTEKENMDIFDLLSKEYPPKHSSIFKSDAEIKSIYSNCEKLTDAEILALKNIEYSMDVKGGLVDFNRGLDVANRYNSPDLYQKIGIMSDDAIRDKYNYFSDMDATDVDTFKAYEYFKLRKVDDECIEKLGVKSDNTLLEQYKFLDENDLTIDKIRTYEYQKNKAGSEVFDTKVYFDSQGKVIGLSCYDDVPSNMVLGLNLSETEHYLSDADMSSKYMDYATYNKIDKLKACQYDYECTQISDMIDNNVISQNGIELMSYDDLKAKYTFIDDTTDSDIIKELQIAEYRDKKYGTTTTDNIEIHFDENGKMSCISDQGFESAQDADIKSNSKFSASVNEVNAYKSADYMATICQDYDKMTPIQKLQMQQLELEARSHNIAKIQELVVNDTTGNLEDLHIIYDADGTVLGIDISGMNDGSVWDVSQKSASFDFSADGNVKARFDTPSSGTAWWRKDISTIIDDKTISSINGVPAEQFRNIKNNMTALESSNIDAKISKAIADIKSTNVDEKALINNINHEKTSFIDRPKNSPSSPNLKMDFSAFKYIDMLGTIGDGIDFLLSAEQARECYENGDIEGAHDVIGKSVCNAAGGMLGVALADVLITAAACSGPVGWVVLLSCGIVGGILGEEIYDTFIDELDDEFTGASTAQPPRDPLVIDLGSSGIDLTSVENGVHFDLDKNGFAEKTAWIGNEDGFLVLDRNGDGEINDGGELFGDQVQLENGLISISGFQALTELDNNHDGIISSNDTNWSQLHVWIDADHNGESKGELKTLDALGITSIELKVFKEQYIDNETGTMEAEYAMVNFADGTQRKISEFWFPVNASDTTQNTEDGERVDTFGNVPNIYTAIENDETGELAQLYEKFLVSKNYVEKRFLAKEILYIVTNSTNIEVNSRGGNIDARSLHIIETFMGRGFSGVNGSNPNTNAASILNDMYTKIEKMYFNMLNVDTEDGVYLNTILVTKDMDENDCYDFDVITVILEEKLKNGENIDSLVYSIGSYLSDYDTVNNTNAFPEFEKQCLELAACYGIVLELSKASNTYRGTSCVDDIWGSNVGDFIFADAGNDTIHGYDGDDIIYGDEGADKIYAGYGNNTVYGGEGNDIIYTEGDNDIIHGGAGDDVMTDSSGKNEWYGGAGKDTFISRYGVEIYHFEAGDGQDIIRQGEPYQDRKGDKILFGESVNKEDIYARKSGLDLILENTVTGDSITIEKAYEESDGSYHIKDIEFADGEKLTANEIAAMVQKQEVHGTEEDDDVRGLNNHYAYDDDEVLHGYAGNDIIHGYDGDDIIYGDEGADKIYAGYGNNTVYGGEGNDIIYTEGDNDIIYGGAGDDVMTDSSGKNEWYGGAGKDTFISRYGVETYHFEAGDGQDIIRQGEPYQDRKGDKILFGESVNKEDINARKSGLDLILENTVTGDSITIEKAYEESDGSYHIKDIEFADGEKLTANEIAAMVQKQEVHGTDGDDDVRGLNNHYAYDDDEVLHGYAGNDIIHGYDGDDIIYGDEGADKIYAGYGNNTVYGGEGNDIIYTEGDNDIIYGGAGDDVINGGYGDDLYVFNQGDGQDKIADQYGNNQISFGEGIGVSNLLISTQNNDVAINFTDSEDMLTLVDGLRYDAYKNFELTFIDGATGTIDLSGEIGAVVIDETVIDENTVEEIVADESVAETQVLQMVDVMNTESGENISVVENIVTTNTVEETLLFVES